MRALAEVLIAFVDLLEAEGRRFAQLLRRALVAAAVAVVFCVLLLAGFGFLMVSMYLALRGSVGPPVAALITGLIAVGVGVFGLVGTKWLIR